MTFQATTNELFRPHPRKYILVFFDDILIYSRTWKEHLQHVILVVQVLGANSFIANRKKCSFWQQEIEYLEHIVDGDEVRMDPAKVVYSGPGPPTCEVFEDFLVWVLSKVYKRVRKDYKAIDGVIKKRYAKNDNVVFRDGECIYN